MSEAPPGTLRAVDHVPRWSVALGVAGALIALLWMLLGENLPGGAALLPLFLVLSAAGLTFGMCGVLLAMRDRMGVGLSVAGILLNCVMPTCMFLGAA